MNNQERIDAIWRMVSYSEADTKRRLIPLLNKERPEIDRALKRKGCPDGTLKEKSCKICNGTGVIDNGAIKGSEEHTYSECECKGKEKSVLTEAEIEQIFLANFEKGVSGQYRAIEQKVLATIKKEYYLTSLNSIKENGIVYFSKEKLEEHDSEVLANYKKGLKKDIDGFVGICTSEDIVEWLLRELGEK